MIFRGNKFPVSAIAAVCMAAALAGCLDEPEIDERWTLVELMATSPGPSALLPADQEVDIAVTGRITYRDIETGFLVAEARYADRRWLADSLIHHPFGSTLGGSDESLHLALTSWFSLPWPGGLR